MALVTLREILSNTRKERYAVGAFNFNDYEDAKGIIEGAKEENSPVILMASMGAIQYIGLQHTAAMIREMANKVNIPVCLHLDHATDFDLIKEAIKCGFTSVMIDASKKNFEENIKESKAVVQFAKPYGCSVEAELGQVGGKEEHIEAEDDEAGYTRPGDVPRFVEETGIDALAVAIGTCHGFYTKEPKLDFKRLEKIAQLTDCPLVLHGGSGISVEDFKRCISMGMSKINVGTELKATFSNALRDTVNRLPESEFDPRNYMKPVTQACKEVVREKIKIFGSSNKAW